MKDSQYPLTKFLESMGNMGNEDAINRLPSVGIHWTKYDVRYACIGINKELLLKAQNAIKPANYLPEHVAVHVLNGLRVMY